MSEAHIQKKRGSARLGAVLLGTSLAALAAGEWHNAVAARRMAKAAVDGYEEVRWRLDSFAMARHDFRKHMTVLRKMLADGETERASSYLDALCDSVAQQTDVAYTGNYMIDLILNSRLGAARDAGVQIGITAVSVPKALAVPDDALTALLCNAVDNAAAAALSDGGGNGWIRIELRGRGEMLYIGIANSCSGGDALRDKPARRGYGRQIMRGVVERCHGVMEAERRGDSYRLSLLLPVRASEDGAWKK